MKIPTALLSAVCSVGPSLSAAASFTVPAAAQTTVGTGTLSGDVIGAAWTRRFNKCDTSDTIDGAPAKHKCSGDANRNSIILLLPSNVLFYDAKMGLDRDGSAHARLRTGTDQTETSLRYPPLRTESLDADRVPYIVIPYAFLDKAHRPVPGDVAAVVYDNHLAFAVVGDVGLTYKIGEGSVRLHLVGLYHDPVTRRKYDGVADEDVDPTYAQGFVTTGNHPTASVMAYTAACPSPCGRWPFWSDPSRKNDYGAPMGESNSAFESCVWRQRLTAVANFHATR